MLIRGNFLKKRLSQHITVRSLISITLITGFSSVSNGENAFNSETNPQGREEILNSHDLKMAKASKMRMKKLAIDVKRKK